MPVTNTSKSSMDRTNNLWLTDQLVPLVFPACWFQSKLLHLFPLHTTLPSRHCDGWSGPMINCTLPLSWDKARSLLQMKLGCHHFGIDVIFVKMTTMTCQHCCQQGKFCWTEINVLMALRGHVKQTFSFYNSHRK